MAKRASRVGIPIGYKIAALRKMARTIANHPGNRYNRAARLAAAFGFQMTGRLLKRRKLTRIGTHSYMWADVHNGASFKAYCGNPPDWSEMTAWRRLLRRGDLFIDVGANSGSYTLWAADAGAEVIAIEPDTASRHLLLENIALNGYSVEVLPIALGPEPGRMLLTSGLGVNYLLPDGTDGSSRVPSQEVVVETLDNVIGDLTAKGVKIDVEGAELLVLQGARRALAEQRIRCIQLEWNLSSLSPLGTGRQPVALLLDGYGYGLFRPDSQGELHFVEQVTDDADVFAMPLG